MYWMDAAGLYTDEPPTRKLQKAPEINSLMLRPTFVISRSGVRIRPPAPTQLNMGEFQSGQMGQTVNLLAMPSVVRIHLPPPNKRGIHADVSFIWRENRGGFEPRALRNVPGGTFQPEAACPQAGECPNTSERDLISNPTSTARVANVCRSV